MRMFVWITWCAVLGALLSIFGLHISENPIWFLLIDGAFLAASWNAFNIVWPDVPKENS